MRNKENLIEDLFLFQVKTLRTLSVITIILSILLATFEVIFLSFDIVYIYIFIIYCICILINVFLVEIHKKVSLEYQIFSTLSLIVIIVITSITGGLQGGFFVLSTSLITGAFISSKKQGVLWTFLVIISFVFLYFLEQSNVDILNIVPKESAINFVFLNLLFLIILSSAMGILYNKANLNSHKSKQIIAKKNIEIERKNQQIMDSIRYAKRIQDALLTSDDFLKQVFKDYFLLYKPMDVVGGDFYWVHKTLNNRLIWAVADCTGHGISGAFMSMVGVSLLNEIVIEKGVNEANQILENLGEGFLRSLSQDEARSGMTMGLCIWDLENDLMEFSGAKTPLYIIRNGELLIYEGTQKAVGYNFKKATNLEFEKYIIKLEKGDKLYQFSDGYYDQMGGPKNQRFLSTNLQKLLLEIHHLPMDEQRRMLKKTLDDWIKNNKQIDDILVMGINIM